MTTQPELCACGEPLHYRSADAKAVMEKIIAEVGDVILVSTGKGNWEVPRHFIALHGIAAKDMPALAIRYGFKEVKKSEKALS